MRNSLFLQLGVFIVLNVLIKPIWVFGIDRYVQLTAGVAEYGNYFALWSASWMGFWILDFGLQNLNSRAASRSNQFISKYFPDILGLKILASFSYLIFSCIWIGLSWNTIDLNWKVLVGILFVQIGISSIQILRTAISAHFMFIQDAFLSIGDKLVAIIGMLLFMYFKPSSLNVIEAVVLAQSIGILLTIGICIVFIRRIQYAVFIRFRWKRMVALAKIAFPFAIIGLVMAFYLRIDVVLLNLIHPNGKSEAGAFASVYRILEAFNIIGFIYAGVLLAVFSNYLKAKLSVDAIVDASSRTLIGASLILATTICFFPTICVELIYNTVNPYWNSIFQVAIWVIPITAFMYIFGTLLAAAGRTKEIIISSIIGSCVSIGLNLVFIPKFGAYGMVIISVLTQSLVIAYQVYTCYKIEILQKTRSLFLRLLTYTACLVLVFVGLKGIGVLNETQQCIVFIGIAGSLFFVFRLFNLEILKLKTERQV